MKKTLGGDRLSSGKRMTVNLKAYERSSHNKGYIWRSTMSPGTIVPFFVQVGTPGSTMDIDLDIDIMTHPTIGPLLGSFKIDAHLFQTPVRLYHAWLHNNKLKIGMNMSAVKLPLITMWAERHQANADDINNSQINPSCLLAYLGIRGVGWNPDDDVAPEREFNAIPLLSYFDIVKNYYTNKQEEIGAIIRGSNLAINETITGIEVDGQVIPQNITGGDPVSGQYGDEMEITYVGLAPDPNQIIMSIITGPPGLHERTFAQIAPDWLDNGAGVIRGTLTYNASVTFINWRYETLTDIPLQSPRVVTFPLQGIDDMREAILQHPGPDPFILNTAGFEPYENILVQEDNGRNPRLNTQEGLAVKTYLSDLFNNWLNTEWIDGVGGITERSRISTAGDFFTLDDLLMGRKIYDLLNRIGVTGGTYKDWIEASYTEIEWNKVESPVYWGGLIKELVFQEVVSNSESGPAGNTQPLGTLAGKGVMAKKHKGGKIVIKLEEHSYVMGLISITPRIDYSQGNEWHVHLKTMDDFHKPAFDEIGFQELITEQMAWWDTKWETGPNLWNQLSAGKQPAWLNYMTEVNKCYGNFAVGADNAVGEMFMTLNRRYERQDGEIKDLTTYIDPAKYNFIFADTSIDAMNFWVQVAVDFTYRAKMSGKLMPNL